MVASTDAIAKAEAIIDEVLMAWGKRELLNVINVKKRVRMFFRMRKQEKWFNEAFSERGWESLIGYRLQAAGKKNHGIWWG